METKPKRRWFRFSLRTLFIAVTLLCVGFGWWVQRSREWIRQRHETWEAEDSKIHPFIVEGQHRDAPGGLWLFGEEGFAQVMCDKQEDIEFANLLFPEASTVVLMPTFFPFFRPSALQLDSNDR